MNIMQIVDQNNSKVLYFCELILILKQMKTKIYFFTISFILVFCIFSYAGDAPTGKVKVIKKNLNKEISKASESGKNAILVVTDNEGNNLDEALSLATETAELSYQTVVGQVNRELEENSDLVQKYNLNRFTLPYVLIISANGSVMGGVVPGRVSAERLAAYVPSCCYNQVIEARADGKPTYVFIPSEDKEVNNNWLKVIEESNSDAKIKANVVSVDQNDENEASFLTKTGYREGMPLPMIVVLNQQGQITSRYNDLPDATALSAAATKVVSGGCGKSCPSSKSCVGKETNCGSK